jgi:hypothetical protein
MLARLHFLESAPEHFPDLAADGVPEKVDRNGCGRLSGNDDSAQNEHGESPRNPVCQHSASGFEKNDELITLILLSRDFLCKSALPISGRQTQH